MEKEGLIEALKESEGFEKEREPWKWGAGVWKVV